MVFTRAFQLWNGIEAHATLAYEAKVAAQVHMLTERLVGDACDRRDHAGGLALAGDAPGSIAPLRSMAVSDEGDGAGLRV
jgi:hypothetical protein